MQHLGCVSDTLIDTAWLSVPKVFTASTLCSVSPAAPFVFRSYEFPPGEATEARRAATRCHEGTSKHKVWQAIRASAAAPYYLEDFSIAAQKFQDGGGIVNNPAVVAVQV